MAERNDRPSDTEMHRRRRGRNFALLAVLVAVIVLFYLITIVRMGSG